MSFKTELEWFSVDEKLPEIPKGKCGVSVICNVYDVCFDEISEGRGCSIYSSVMYMSVKDSKGNYLPFCEGIKGEFMFAELGFGHDKADWLPICDEVTHWAYEPLPIDRKYLSEEVRTITKVLRDDTEITQILPITFLKGISYGDCKESKV